MITQQKSVIEHFDQYRQHIIGIDHVIPTPYGQKKLIYADWIASGRLYLPIERLIQEKFGPMVGNTHSESSDTGHLMTEAYHQAKSLIKKHVNAGPDDVLLTSGTGMTGALAKFQRILGLKYPSSFGATKRADRPVVFITHMEHHSNQISWLECDVDVVIIPPNDELKVNPENLRPLLEEYKDRKLKIGAFTACSNVTGIETPYFELSRIMHEHDGVCFVDFAASAPYVNINMHPEDPLCRLDAIFFSPHKFLGGPGSSGVLVFDRGFYRNASPDEPGGGTVTWTNPWGEYAYFNEIELREDGGTPGFLQAIRTALCVKLKEEMDVNLIREREKEIISRVLGSLREMSGIQLLAGDQADRMGVVAFYSNDLHYNLFTRLLNDLYGIQARGGCSCAGTYGHLMMEVSREKSRFITNLIDKGDHSHKPGWTRLSFHPTTTDAEVDLILEGVEHIAKHGKEYIGTYTYNSSNNEWRHPAYPDRATQVAAFFQFN